MPSLKRNYAKPVAVLGIPLPPGLHHQCFGLVRSRLTGVQIQTAWELVQREHGAMMESLVQDFLSMSLWSSDVYLGST